MNEMIEQLPNGDFIVNGPVSIEYWTADQAPVRITSYATDFDKFNVARCNALNALVGIGSAPSDKSVEDTMTEFARLREKYIGHSGRAIAAQIKEAARAEVATADPERVRAALTWNTRTPFNPFPGFTVQSVTSEQPRTERHALQRGGDVS